MTKKQIRITLDEILKLLFKASNKVIVPIINELYHENHHPDEVEIIQLDKELINREMEIVEADLYLQLKKTNFERLYHIEFQTKNDKEMVIRIFEYGFKKSLELWHSSTLGKNLVFEFPKPTVIYFEKNTAIQKELTLQVIFPDGFQYPYKVPVIKYWDYSQEELLAKKLYLLLPLQLFNLRKEMETARKKNNSILKQKLGKQALALTKELHLVIKELYDRQEITFTDYDKLVVAIENLIEYLSKKYINDKILESEVKKMTITAINPEVEKRGIEQGIEIGIEQGIELGIINSIKILAEVSETKELAAEKLAAVYELPLPTAMNYIEKYFPS